MQQKTPGDICIKWKINVVSVLAEFRGVLRFFLNTFAVLRFWYPLQPPIAAMGTT